ncbi:Methyltransferase-like protein 13 [Diplonema papillatum]|nr:Methyltransferase-like protein 13 [Diplonema papillatum]
MAHYSNKDYWEARYEANPKPYEWYVGYAALCTVLKKWMRQGSRVMVAGCGNSTLCEDLYDNAGFTNVVGVDFSTTVVQAMRDRVGRREGVSYIAEDLRSLPFPPGTFDCIIDKATLDSCLCGTDSSAAQRSGGRVIAEVVRMLKPGGVFLSLSHSARQERQLYTAPHLPWQVTVDTVPKDYGTGSLPEEQVVDDHPHYFLYACTKAIK